MWLQILASCEAVAERALAVSETNFALRKRYCFMTELTN